jgi:hypothetical protein
MLILVDQFALNFMGGMERIEEIIIYEHTSPSSKHTAFTPPIDLLPTASKTPLRGLQS